MAASFVFNDAEVVFVVDDDCIGFHLVGGAGCLVEENESERSFHNALFIFDFE